jgi:hypothetical protein
MNSRGISLEGEELAANGLQLQLCWLAAPLYSIIRRR